MKEDFYNMATTAVDSANLLLKLYELRREETMREARNFMFTFHPASAQEYMAAMMGPHSGHIRMVMSYWDMACSFVVNGAIDPKMFNETNGEHIMAFAKIEPLLADLRAIVGPTAFQNLEKVCLSDQVGIEKVRQVGERIKGFAAQMAAAAQG
jgi:hypothetical protein